MPKTSSEQSDSNELSSLSGVSIAYFGGDPDEGEWYFIFTNGTRMTLSAVGDDMYYYISEVLH